jgi:hypothetical protein
MPTQTRTWSGVIGYVNTPTDDGLRMLVCAPGQYVAVEQSPLPLRLQTPRGIIQVGQIRHVERDGTAINATGSITIDPEADWWAVGLLYGDAHPVGLTITKPLVHTDGGKTLMTGWKVRSAVLIDAVAWRGARIVLTDLPERGLSDAPRNVLHLTGLTHYAEA